MTSWMHDMFPWQSLAKPKLHCSLAAPVHTTKAGKWLSSNLGAFHFERSEHPVFTLRGTRKKYIWTHLDTLGLGDIP